MAVDALQRESFYHLSEEHQTDENEAKEMMKYLITFLHGKQKTINMYCIEKN